MQPLEKQLTFANTLREMTTQLLDIDQQIIDNQHDLDLVCDLLVQKSRKLREISELRDSYMGWENK